ncbi:WXG100 family type VII secretion target [Streptomyces sp. NPDC059740]|uniref:WXG100 family type VII secretion target n=1 Tax=Streptomyces sp. NPDC059740 TaxID=3346926 RepID=UPI003651B3A4
MTGENDPEAMQDAAAGWRDMGAHLDEMVRDLDRHVARVRAHHWQGPAAEAFGADWDRLKTSVDDSLPAFEETAVHLESAAAAPAPPATPSGDGPDAAAHDTGSGSGGSGTQTAYGIMALGQIAGALGGMFGRGGRGGKGGQSRGGPQLHARWEVPAAPAGPDPFGTPDGRAPADRGGRAGENVARGRRRVNPLDPTTAPNAQGETGRGGRGGATPPAQGAFG